MAAGGSCMCGDELAGVLTILHVVGTHNHENFAAAWCDIHADHGNVLAGGVIERGCDRGTIHWVDDQCLGAFLDQCVDVRDLLGGVIVGDQRSDQSGVVLSCELCLIRDIVSPEVGVVEGQRNTELEVRARCECTS